MLTHDFCSGHRKWNTLAFRGRLMSLLVLTHSGVSPRPHLPQDKEGFGSDTSHAEKVVYFFKESRIFHKCLIHNPKYCTVDWNGKRPPAVEINSFSSRIRIYVRICILASKGS